MLRRKSGSVTVIHCILSYHIISYHCLVGKVYVEHLSELVAFLGKYATLVLYAVSESLLVKSG